MADLDEYIFGYANGKICEGDTASLVNCFLKLGIPSSVDASGKFTLRERDRSRLVGYSSGNIRIELGEPRGLYGFLKRAFRRSGALSALLIVFLMLVFSRALVWDVRVSGNVQLSDSDVVSALADCGFAVGSRWRGVDKSLVEAALLASHPEIAWISLNRRGVVAYVEILESENVGLPEEQAPLYSNIVAEKDGVVEEITVKSGEAQVKIGDVVRKGDILISGVIQTERGVTLCRAEGTVRASCATNVSTEVGQTVTEEIYRDRFLADTRVTLFNFSLNIFKNYRNYGNSCDIIEEIREFALFGRCKLPLKVSNTYVREYADVTRTLTEFEMTAAARAELNEIIRSTFQDSDVVGLKSSGEFSDGCYRLTTRVIYVTDITKEQAIEIT